MSYFLIISDLNKYWSYKVVPPSYVCWFINPSKYRYNLHNPKRSGTINQLNAIFGAPHCTEKHHQKMPRTFFGFVIGSCLTNKMSCLARRSHWAHSWCHRIHLVNTMDGTNIECHGKSINGWFWEFQDPKMEVRGTICLAIFCGDIPLHSPYIGLIYGRYLQCRFLKWPLMWC